MQAAAKIDVNLALIFIFCLLLNHTHINTMMMATGRRFAGAYVLLHGGLVPKRDYGSYCIVLARCGRFALSSITVLRGVESTAAIGTIEFEPGLQHDLPAILDKLISPSRNNYGHEQTWHDGAFTGDPTRALAHRTHFCRSNNLNFTSGMDWPATR
jgi:hypothetical protein